MESLLAKLRPRLTKFIPNTPTPKQTAFLMVRKKECLFGGAAGGGKVSYEGDKILTPFGYKATEDLQVGDAVCNPDGSHARITWLHPWDNYQVWTVEFHDGTKLDVAEEHLWLAWRSGKRKKKSGKVVYGESAAEVVPTCDLKKWCDTALDQESRGVRPNWPCIPVCQEQHFNVTFRPKNSIDPYLLGVLLGDGYISEKSITITSEDTAHTTKLLSSLGYDYHIDAKPHNKAKSYRLRGDAFQYVRHQCKKLNLVGKTSIDKFIPEKYKLGSIETRWSVLQGLMDTDGTVDKRGHLSFCTISEQLANDVTFLVQSLGGTSTISKKDMGEHNDAYTLYIKLHDENKAFRLKRKKDRCKETTDNMYRRVVSVKKTKRVRYGRCITVSHPNGLYLAENFIVTHNSDALLMAALQYVDIPGYTALCLRKSLADLELPGALLDRAKAWLQPWIEKGDVKYSARERKFIFRTKNPDGTTGYPAIVQFGYIGDSNAKLRYQGAEFQFVAFDEVTQHNEGDYTYLFSRLRKNVCKFHPEKDENGEPIYHDDCPWCQQQKMIPLRIRGATNPGGPGHLWVKNRYVIDYNEKYDAYIGNHHNRPFIPSFLKDNPFIDQKSYMEGLQELDPVTRDQLAKGDWGVVADNKFSKGNVRYFKYNGIYYSLGPGRTRFTHGELQRIFFTVDPAGSVKAGPGDDLINPKLPKSHTVISVWGLTKEFDLLWLDMNRMRKQIPDVADEVARMYRDWRPAVVLIEKNGLGLGVLQLCQRMGLPVQQVIATNDKVVNSTAAQIRFRNGQVFIREDASWRKECEDELFTWQGNPHENDDIVDTLSTACNDIAWEAAPSEYSALVESPVEVDACLPGIISPYGDDYGSSIGSYGYRF